MGKLHHWAPNLIFVLLAFGACAHSSNSSDTEAEAIKSAEQVKATEKAEKIAEKVKQKSRATEKAEGKQDLVKDSVTVTKSANGDPVIEQTGEASNYGRGFHGKTTANGEKFNKNDLTAASPALPLGTKAKVTNLDNGKSVDVRINDRGPYVKGRDIDLSQGAAKELDINKKGIAPVKIEAEVPPLNEEEKDSASAAREKTMSEKK
jgi:rare lipoprotein A